MRRSRRSTCCPPRAAGCARCRPRPPCRRGPWRTRGASVHRRSQATAGSAGGQRRKGFAPLVHTALRRRGKAAMAYTVMRCARFRVARWPCKTCDVDAADEPSQPIVRRAASIAARPVMSSRSLRLALAILSLSPVDTVRVVGALAHLLDQRAESLVLAHLGKVWIQRLLATEQFVELGLDVGVLARVG